VGVVKRRSEFVRLTVSASVQVGEHQAGAGGCRASWGSGGIAAALIGAGGKAGDVLAQLVSNATAGSNAPSIQFGLNLSILDLLVACLLATLFFGALFLGADSGLPLPLTALGK